MEGQKKLENVYLQQNAAESFMDFASYDKRLFQNALDCLNKAGLDRNKPYSILDLGTGGGDFVIPLARKMLDSRVDTTIFGIDSSEAMIALAQDKAKGYKMQGRVWWGLHDLNTGLADFPQNRWDIVLSIFSLHYVKAWNRLLHEIHSLLPLNGYFIMSEATGDIPLLEAEWDKVEKDIDPYLVQFWKKYHEMRQNICPFNPELKTSRMNKAITRNKELYANYHSTELHWYRNVSYASILSWLKIGVIAAFGSGLEKNDCIELASGMRQFLKKKNRAESSQTSIRYGVKLHLFKKT